jgi:hypothetical protein
MSQRDVEWTLGRLITDGAFRREFFLRPEAAAIQIGATLTPEERAALLRTPKRILTEISVRLDDRICRLCLDEHEDARALPQ